MTEIDYNIVSPFCISNSITDFIFTKKRPNKQDESFVGLCQLIDIFSVCRLHTVVFVQSVTCFSSAGKEFLFHLQDIAQSIKS